MKMPLQQFNESSTAIVVGKNKYKFTFLFANVFVRKMTRFEEIDRQRERQREKSRGKIGNEAAVWK
jgi:hypothetical protein